MKGRRENESSKSYYKTDYRCGVRPGRVPERFYPRRGGVRGAYDGTYAVCRLCRLIIYRSRLSYNKFVAAISRAGRQNCFYRSRLSCGKFVAAISRAGRQNCFYRSRLSYNKSVAAISRQGGKTVFYRSRLSCGKSVAAMPRSIKNESAAGAAETFFICVGVVIYRICCTSCT